MDNFDSRFVVELVGDQGIRIASAFEDENDARQYMRELNILVIDRNFRGKVTLTSPDGRQLSDG